MKMNERMKKGLSILLCVLMLAQQVPTYAFAVTTAEDNLCAHHTAHTADCGYREGSAGSACTHVHSEDCYEIVDCKHTHSDECDDPCTHECTVDNGCITMELDCHHTHGDCGYSEGTAEVPCGHTHSESCGYAQALAGSPCANAETDPECDHSGDCGYVAALEGAPCGHTACDDTCGYAPATEGTPCTHTHAVKINSADSCYKLLCSHKDGGHDETCGYAAAVEAHECHYECAECAENAFPSGEGGTAPAVTEEATSPAPDGGTLPKGEGQCDCGTDDESIHATTCAVYVAPETAVCHCAEKCSEPNIWCDVCGFDYTQCGGTDTAAVYTDGTIDLSQYSEGATVDITEDCKIVGDGNEYNLSLNIAEDATVIFDVGTSGVKLGGQITVADGKTLTLLVAGDAEHTVSGGISLGNSSNVVIEGDLAQTNNKLTVTATDGNAGIGANGGVTAGDITIRNARVDATGSSKEVSENHDVGIMVDTSISGAAIGTSDGSMGNILIENSIIVAAGGYYGNTSHAPAIGIGFVSSTMGNITLKDSQITASNNGDGLASVIGAGANRDVDVSGTLGDIIITNTDLNLSMAISTDNYYAAMIGPGVGRSNAWVDMGKIIFTDVTKAKLDEMIATWSFPSDFNRYGAYALGRGFNGDYDDIGVFGGVWVSDGNGSTVQSGNESGYYIGCDVNGVDHNFNGTCGGKCSVCGVTYYVVHTMGTAATCTAKAVCSVCGKSYGEFGSHTAEPTYALNADGSQHIATYSCCGATVTEDHTTTAQATCSSKAICELCGEYGDTNANNHTGTLGTPVPTTDGTQHTATYDCCNGSVTENHTFSSATGNCQFCAAAMAEAKVTSGGVDTYYETLASALGAAQSGDTVTLCSNVDLGTTDHVIPAGVTFCGGEYTVTGSGAGWVYNYGIIEDGIFAFYVSNGETGTVNGGEFTLALDNYGTVNGGSFVTINCYYDSTLSGTVSIADEGSLTYAGGCTIDLSNAVFGDGAELANGTEQELYISSLHLPDNYAVALDGNVVSVLPAYNEGSFVSHSHAYEDKNDATHHWKECACGKTTEKAEHSYTYTNDGDTHTATCSVSVCAYSKSEAHTLTYSASGSTITAACSANCGSSGTATVSATGKTYDGTAVEATVAKTGILENEAIAITYAVKDGAALEGAPANAGTYTASITLGEGDAAKTVSVEFTIQKKSITATVTAQDKTYDGSTTAEVAATVTEGLVLGDSITISGLTGTFSDADAGENKTVTIDSTNVSVTGTNADCYEISYPATVTATINQATSSIAFNGYAPSKTYDGTALANPTIDQLTITGAGYNDVEFAWYKDSVDDANKLTGAPKDAGTYYVVASIAETTNTSGSSATSGAITISPKAVTSPTITLTPDSYVYDSQAKEPAVTVKDGNTTIPASEYTVEYSNNTNVGPATVTIKDVTGGNYTVSGSTTFEITKAQQAALSITNQQTDPAYGSTFQLGTSGGSGTGEVTWAVTDGSTYATVDGNGNVQITGVGAFTVTATKAGGTNYEDATATYSGTSVQADPGIGEVSYSGSQLFNSTAVSSVVLTRANTSVAGTLALTDTELTAGEKAYNWMFTPQDTTNYKTVTGTVTLNVQEDTIQSIAPNGTLDKSEYTYGDTFSIAGLTVTATYTSGATKDVTELVSFDSTLAVDQTSVELTYQGKTCEVTGITVTKKQIVISGMSWTVPTDAVYSGTAYTATLNGTLPEGVTVTKTGDKATNAGNYTAKAVFSLADGYSAENYEIVNGEDLTAEWSIAKASMTITGTDYSGTYDGKANGEAAVPSVTMGTTVSYSTDNGATWSSDVPTITNVGTVNVKVKAENPNYVTATDNYTLTVNRKAVTVTAADKTKVYGENDPALSATVTGLVNGEAESLIVYNLSRDEGENVGEYTITPTGEATQGNYSVTFEPAKLTITKANPTCTAPTGLTATYGDLLSSVTLNNPNGNTSGAWAWNVSDSNATVGNVGSNAFSATFTPVDQGNYTTATKDVTVTVGKANSEVSTPPAAKTNLFYDGTAQELVNAGTATGGTMHYSLTENGSYSDEIPTATAAKTYTVWYKVVGDSNHNDTTPATVTVTISKAATNAPDSGDGYTIDYGEETITVEAGYEIFTAETDGTEVKSGSVADHFGKKLYIRVKETENHAASDWTELIVAARPAQPNVTVKNETLKGQEDGAITGFDTTMEYSTDNGAHWVSVQSTTVMENKAGNTTIQFRVKATSTAPHGEVKTCTIAAGKPITVTYSSEQAATGMPAKLENLSYGHKLTEPADPKPENEDFAFRGWYKDATFSNEWDFANDIVAEENVTIYAKWEQVYFTVKASIVDHNNATYHGNVTVKLMRGNDQIDSVTGTNGSFTFSRHVEAGMYNLVAVYTDNDGEHTKTELITVDHDETYVLTLPAPGVNSHLNVGNDAVASGVMVGGLDKEAAVLKGENESVKVEMTVEGKTESQVSSQVVTDIDQAIKTNTGSAEPLSVEYLDINVTKEVTNSAGTTSSAITVTSNLMEIVVPFDFTGKDIESIHVYRHHDGTAAPMNKTQVRTESDGNFYIDEVSGYIHIFTKKFSTYAIAYAVEYQVKLDANGGTLAEDTLEVNSDGTLKTLPTPTREGYVFKGWYTAKTGGTQVTTSTVFSDDATIYARWSGYTVTVAKTSNGTVSVDRTEAPGGTQVTITVTPKSGYKMATVTVKDANGSSRAVSTDNNGKYYFTMPNANVTVTVTFSKISTATADLTNPKTGDSFNMPLWIGIMSLSAMAIVDLLVWRKKRNMQ